MFLCYNLAVVLLIARLLAGKVGSLIYGFGTCV